MKIHVFTFVFMLAYTSGFKCQRPNIFSLAIARPTREIVHQYVVYRNEDLKSSIISDGKPKLLIKHTIINSKQQMLMIAFH